MKKFGLVLIFLICFVTVDGFCGGSKNRYVTVTNDLITFVNDNGGNIYALKYYLSTSTPLILTTSDNSKVEIKNSEKGKLEVYTPGDKKSLEVVFLKKYKLHFEYNSESKTFDLVSAYDTIDGKVFNEPLDPKPNLRVYYRTNDHLNLSAVPTYPPAPGQDGETKESSHLLVEVTKLPPHPISDINPDQLMGEFFGQLKGVLESTIPTQLVLTDQGSIPNGGGTSANGGGTSANGSGTAADGGGTSGSGDETSVLAGRSVPITKELVNAVNSLSTNGQGLNDLDYYLSIPLTLTLVTNDPENGSKIEAGVFVVSEKTITDTIEITPEYKGKLVKYTPGGREKFEVTFSGTNPAKTVSKTVILTFERNEQKNSFDLTAASENGKAYTVNTNRGEPIPQLSIHYTTNQNAIITVQTASRPAGTEGRMPDPPTPAPPTPAPPTLLPPVLPLPISTLLIPIPRAPTPAAIPSYIIGEGTLTTKVVVDYIRRNNPGARNVEALVDTYISEAKLETINWDIAIAQMCYATDYLRNQQLINTRNYAGFADTNGVPVRYDFINYVDYGVRAHIQHLAWYANGKLKGTTNVDKRYNVLAASGLLGKVQTLDDLFQYWAVPTRVQAYGAGINSILNDLYRFSGR